MSVASVDRLQIHCLLVDSRGDNALAENSLEKYEC